ncbi:MAG: ABC transporter ATP-binding protein, partial [Methylomonas sp.]
MATPCITVDNLTMTYGSFVIQHDLNFTINRGDVFIIMGGNGGGKTTVLRHMIGLKAPAQGDVIYGDQRLWQSDPETRQSILRRTGVLFQSGALLSSMTLAENVALPITEATRLPANRVREVVSYKLALVGLAGFEDYYPSELSGGMQRRAGLARA